VDLGVLDAGCDWTEIGRNVVGEMQLAVLLRRHGGKAAAAGWDGDRFAVFEGANNNSASSGSRPGTVTTTHASSPRATHRFQTTKIPGDHQQPDGFPEANRRPHQGTVFAVERRRSDVVVVEGFDPETTERLVEAAFRARKTEMTHAPAAQP